MSTQHTFTSEAITRHIRVSVVSEYAPSRSAPNDSQWFFLYTITIANEGEETVQLLTRHWLITDGTGRVEEVRGPGVIGQQPTLKPGETFTGQLVAIAPEVDEKNRHFRIEVRVANPDGNLLAGMYATARLVLSAAENALTVPREAITTRDGKRVVLKVDSDKVTPVEVVEGLSDGRQVQVVSGLNAGDLVIADARRQLPADARVKAILQ